MAVVSSLLARCAWDTGPVDPTASRALVVADTDVHLYADVRAPRVSALRAGDSFDALATTTDALGETWIEYPSSGWLLAEDTSATAQGFRLRARDDMNADGRDDLLYEATHAYCGSSGCSYRLLVATDRGYELAFDRQAYQCWAAEATDSGHRAIDCWFRHFFGPGYYVLVARWHWRDGRYVDPPLPSADWTRPAREEVTLARDTAVMSFPSAPDRFVATTTEDTDESPPALEPIPVVTRLQRGSSFVATAEARDGAECWLRYDEGPEPGWVRVRDTDLSGCSEQLHEDSPE